MSFLQRINVAKQYVEAFVSYSTRSDSFYQSRKSAYWLLSLIQRTFPESGCSISFKEILDHPFIPIRSKFFALRNEFEFLSRIEVAVSVLLVLPLASGRVWSTWLVFLFFGWQNEWE